jgi:hypothetical protein
MQDKKIWTPWTPFRVFPEKSYEKCVQEKDPRNRKNGVHGARITILCEVEKAAVRECGDADPLPGHRTPGTDGDIVDRLSIRKSVEKGCNPDGKTVKTGVPGESFSPRQHLY